MTTMDENRPELRTKGRPSVKEAARIDHAILHAARKVLLEQGEAASLNAVAKQAGLSRKSVYARYASREDLFIAAVQLTLQNVGPVQFADAANFEDRLCNYVTAALNLLSSNAAMAFQQVLSTNVHIVSDMRGEMLAASRKIFFEPLVDLLQQAHDEGKIALDEPQLTARVIFSATIAYAVTSDAEDGTRQPDKSAYEQYARRLARTISTGLVPR